MSSGFVHLHVHSQFSFMDGAASLPALVARAAELGMPALALTDHQGLSGAIRFYKACRDAGISAIIGCEVVVEPAGIRGADESDLPPDARLCDASFRTGFGRASGTGYHLTLLCKDIEGYRNLCRLLSRTHLRGPSEPSVVTLADLAAHSEGLIGLSGCPRGEVPSAVAAGSRSRTRARHALQRLAGCFAPGDFYVELVNQLEPGSPQLLRGLLAIAAEAGLPVVATNNVHYLEAAGHRLHDVLASVGARMPLPGPLGRSNAELWLKPAAEMRQLFEGMPQACDATLRIAERCKLELPLGRFHFPSADIPKGETPYSALAKEAWRGLERRYRPLVPEAISRLQHELSLIDTMGFSEYFMVVKEIVDHARSRGIRCSGRGSAGDSIVSYALGITDADPVRHDLLFERFLNPERRQMPDIDVDFDSARRDEVIDFIYRRFGEAHVAMVATVNTMTARSAVRVVARSFGMPRTEVDHLSRYLPWVRARHIRDALVAYPECHDHPLRDERRFGLLLDLAEELDRCPMHLGTHLGGFVITRDPIASWTPLQWAAKGTVVSQYDKDDIEALGLVKMDILGLRMHSAISEAVSLARARKGAEEVPEPFELIPDDPAVFAGIAAGDTVGMFQLESSGQRNLSTRLRPSRFEDIIAQISLFRPGPLQADMITPFIRRRHGLEPVVIPHESMREPLADSYGVIVFQEQVLLVARAVAGFDLAQADMLRRAMTRGRSHEDTARIRESFIERAVARGVEQSVAEEVFRQIEGFAAYGFNKAHAACFAVISYASAWLKTHYPAELAAGIMNHLPMGFYSGRVVINDARRHGIEIRGPHVNESMPRYTVEADGRALRVGLRGVRGVPQRLLAQVERERVRRPFADVGDFLRRTHADATAAQSLERIGALDGLGGASSGRPTAEKLAAEMELMGLALTAHPLEIVAADLDARGVTRAAEIPAIPDRTQVRVAGLRERAQTPPTRSGKRTCFLTLEDATGLLDVVVFEDVLAKTAETIVKDSAYIVDGIVQNNPERGIAIVAENVVPYDVRRPY